MDVIIRTDASFQIGSGHLMRMLVLAQRLSRREHRVHFFCVNEEKGFLQRILDQGYSLDLLPKDVPVGGAEDAANTFAVAKKYNASWVICDGYALTKGYHGFLISQGLKTLCVDDMAHHEVQATLVLNQNYGIDRNQYIFGQAPQFFLGPEYAMVREEFYPYLKQVRQYPQLVNKILVTMGGADPDDVTSKALHAIRAVQFASRLSVRVILGGMNKKSSLIRAEFGQGPFDLQVIQDVRQGMGEHMVWADMALTAGGSIIWEYGMTSVPVLAVVLADNQEAIVHNLSQAEAILSLGEHSKFQVELWRKQIEKLAGDCVMRKRISQRLRKFVSNNRLDEVINVMEGMK